MTNHLLRMTATLALLALVSWPALADTQFRARRMTRGDVPLGKGQCDIRLRIDGEAEVSVRGDMVYLRTVNGRDGRDEGSECNEPLPDRIVEGFGFEVRDRRGDIALLSEPSRRNGFRAVVRIRDSEGGEGRYHFRLSWQMDGGRDPFGSGSGPGYGSDPGDSRRRGGAAGLSYAIDACRDAVGERIAAEYRYDDVDIRNARADNGPGRNDYIIGEATGRRGRAIADFSFVCRVDFNSGRVRTVDVRRR